MTLVRFEYAPGEITTHCAQQIAQLNDRLNTLAADPKQSFAHTVEEFERIVADFTQNTDVERFMCNVHTDPVIREESRGAEQACSNATIEVFARQDIYDAISAVNASLDSKPLLSISPVQRRLIDHILLQFRQNGLGLEPEAALRVKQLMQEHADVNLQFRANLDKNTDFVAFTHEELDGVSEDFISRLERTSNGEYKVLTNSADVPTVMQNAHRAQTRRTLLEKYENRESEKNMTLLQRALDLRRELAKLLGYETWADYRMQTRMAKDKITVITFLNRLREQLIEKNKEDLKRLLEEKQLSATLPDIERSNIDGALKTRSAPLDNSTSNASASNAVSLEPWDLAYYENQAKKKDCDIDEDALRAYFPFNHVLNQVLAMCAELFGITFEPMHEPVWAPEVRAYSIRAQDGTLIAHFYADLFPRPGKYSHAAMFELRTGRFVNGKYVTPIAAIVANFTPASEHKESLLSHDEVETLFHELGHILHGILTTAPYAMFAGTHVAWDFVEVPSQMLQNWAWDSRTLKRISLNEHGSALPDETIARLVASQQFMQGRATMRQLLLATYDMRLHTGTMNEPIDDPLNLYRQMYRDFITISPPTNTHFPATFGHLMGWYDAGYYGYLWSKVYAQDIFSQFEQCQEIPEQKNIGRAYRQQILAPGDTQDAIELLRTFLGREPNDTAFLRSIGIDVTCHNNKNAPQVKVENKTAE